MCCLTSLRVVVPSAMVGLLVICSCSCTRRDSLDADVLSISQLTDRVAVGETSDAFIQFQLAWPLSRETMITSENLILLGYFEHPPKDVPLQLFQRLRNAEASNGPEDADAYVLVAGTLGGSFSSVDEFEVLTWHRDLNALTVDVQFRHRSPSYDLVPVVAQSFFSLCLPLTGDTPREVHIRFQQVEIRGVGSDVVEEQVPSSLEDVLVIIPD